MHSDFGFIAQIIMWQLAVGELLLTSATPLANVLAPIRILPLGDSLTLGTGSSDSGSYRRPLLLSLHGQGYDVDFVGPLHTGSAAGDPDNAGYFGHTILEVLDEIATQNIVAKYKPRYILLLIGTNNMGNDKMVDQAPADLRKLLAELFRQGPRTSVLVGTLIQTATTEFNQRIDAFNPKLKAIASELAGRGYPISWVDLSTAIDPASDLKDGLHPNDKGYEKMATAWFESLKHKLLVYGARILQHNPHFQTIAVVPARSFDENYVSMWHNHGMVIDLADSGGDLHSVSPLSKFKGISTSFDVECNVPVGVTFRVRDSPVTQFCPHTCQHLHVHSNTDDNGLYINTTVGDSTWRVYHYTFTPNNTVATLSFQAPGEVAGVCGPSIADVVVRQNSLPLLDPR